MNDCELLELAAEAAGLDLTYCPAWSRMAKKLADLDGEYFDGTTCWNPLTDDGDAFRLAVELGMAVYTGENWARAQIPNEPVFEEFAHEDYQDIFAATRRAIVRAAAEIGRQMQEGGAA